MKNILIIVSFFILALTTGCEDEYLDYPVTPQSEPIIIVVKDGPYHDLKFHTEVSRYEYGKERNILLEGDLKPQRCDRKESYLQATFVIKKENSPRLYEELLNHEVLFVVTSDFKMFLKFKSDIKLTKGRNEIDFRN